MKPQNQKKNTTKFSSRDVSLANHVRLLIIGFSLVVSIVTAGTIFLVQRDTNNKINLAKENNILSSIATNIDGIIEQYHELAVQISGTPCVRKYILTKGGSTGSKKTDVESMLAVAQSQHAYLGRIWLYDVRSGIIINDQYGEESLHLSEYGDITQKYLSGEIPTNRIHYNGWYTNLFVYENDLYLAREFPIQNDSMLGILFLHLDLNAIYKNTQNKNSLSEDSFYVIDACGNIVHQLSGKDTNRNQIFIEMFNNGGTVSTTSNMRYLLNISETTSWGYGCVFSIGSPLTFDAMMIITILITVIILASIYLSSLINRYSIEPLQELADHTRQLFDINDKNEINVLSQTVKIYNESRRQYESDIATISTQITDSFFNDLCHGKTMNANYINTALKLINSPIDMSGIYWVVEIRHPANCNIDLIKKISAIVESVILKMQINSIRFHMNSYQEHTIIVFELSMKVSPTEANVFRRYIFENILDAFTQYEMGVEIGNGDLVYTLSDLHHSYKYASDRISESKSSINDSDIITQKNTTEASVVSGSSNNQYASMICSLFKQVDDNRLWQAEEELRSKMHAFAQVSPNDLDFICKSVNDSMFELATKHGLTTEFHSPSGSLPNDVLNATLAFCLQCFQERDNNNKKNNRQLATNAECYILQHYHDPNISLNMIATALKTSPSNLSKVFKLNKGVGCIEYINKKRIDQAKKLLIKSDCTVKDIATQVGFFSEQTFFRVFKKYTNTTPHQYRLTKK